METEKDEQLLAGVRLTVNDDEPVSKSNELNSGA
jgi:hypothetical protein